MGLRKETKNIAAAVLTKSRHDSEIFRAAGQAFVKGFLDYREEHFGDSTYIGPRPPANVSEEEYRIGEFRYGIRTIKRLLGFEGPSYFAMALPGKDYVDGLKDIEEILPVSIGNCAMLILREQYPYHYASGEVARGYAVFSRLLTSNKFLTELEQGDTAEVFFRHLVRLCERTAPKA